MLKTRAIIKSLLVCDKCNQEPFECNCCHKEFKENDTIICDWDTDGHGESNNHYHVQCYKDLFGENSEVNEKNQNS